MKFNFPKILREFPLAEYAPELQEKITVWVNPTGKLLIDLADTFNKWIEKRKDEDFDAHLAVVSELLSQGEPSTRWSVDELRELKLATQETDPQFWMWFSNRYFQEITEHRAHQKKT